MNKPESAVIPPTGERRHNHSVTWFGSSIPLIPSMWWVAGMAALSFASVASVASLIQLLVYRSSALGTVLAPAFVASLLMFYVAKGIRNRRMATQRRLHAICELNDHVRNGLQQIAAVTAVHASGGYEEIQNAIDRIERILRNATTEIRSDD